MVKRGKMIISISGTPGSGKTTLAKFLAKQLKLKSFFVGELVRKIAEKRGLSIVDLDKAAVTDRTIDREIDKIHLKLNGKDNFVIDSRVAFKFFPKSIKIFLHCKPEIAAMRIFKAKRPEERMAFRKTLNEVRKRNRIDRLRYRQYYRIDIDDLSNYDLVIDTSGMSMGAMNNAVLKAILGRYK